MEQFCELLDSQGGHAVGPQGGVEWCEMITWGEVEWLCQWVKDQELLEQESSALLSLLQEIVVSYGKSSWCCGGFTSEKKRAGLLGMKSRMK